ECRSAGGLCEPRRLAKADDGTHQGRGMKSLALLAAALLLAGAAWAAEPLLELQGRMEQGGLIIARTAPGAEATLDGTALDMDAEGNFAFGFDRDHGKQARLTLRYPDGSSVERMLDIAPRDWKIQRVEGVPQKFVT